MITNDRTYSSDQLQTTVLYQAVWEGKEEDYRQAVTMVLRQKLRGHSLKVLFDKEKNDFEPGVLLDRDKDNAF